MEEDVTKTVIKTLRAYLSDELPLDQDFIRKLDHRDLLASDKAPMLVALADKGDRSCIHQLITYMEQFYTEEMLLMLCVFLEEYAQQARPRLAVIASRIRQEISKHKPQVTPPVPEDTLHRSAGGHDEPPEMDTEGGNSDAPSRPPGAGTKRGHQTAKEDAPIAKNPKPADFEAVVEPPEMNTGASNVLLQPLGTGTKRGHQTAKTDTPIAKNPNPAKDLHLLDDSSPPSPPSPPPPTWTEQYEKAIKQRGSVTLDITRCVLIGPPRVGKSSLKLLLINNEPPSEDVKKSTDLMEAPVVLTSIQDQDKKGSQWKELTPRSLQQLVSRCSREEEYDPAQPNPMQSSYTSLSIAVASDTDVVSTTVAESSNTSMHLADSELEMMYHHFVGATMSEESLAKLKMNGLKMVHVFDCGGQLAFQDTIPLLINAPCTFISVFNASIDLDEEVELKYCPKKGVELGLGHKESQWNMLRRIFSSIHSLQFKCHDDISQLLKDKTVVPSSPIAVVGTHKDVLCEASTKDEGLMQRTEEKIKKRLEQLRESKPYAFLRGKGHTLDLVANLSKDDISSIEFLRRDIVKSKATLSLKLPLSWIILELFTRNLEKKFIPFLYLQQLCIHDHIVRDKEEFSSLLQVLHVLGFYAFYQLDGVPEDQNWVCTDAATLYREVTKILVVQYKKNIKKGATIELQQYGRIKLNKATLEDVFTDLEISIGGADPMWLIRVLLHIGLAAKIEDEGLEEVFIPLALPFKHSDLPSVTSVATICFSLEFPSRASKIRVRANFTEIPRGIFPRLIVYLLSQQRLGEFEWVVGKGDSRSRIKLRHHSYNYVIYLSEHVDHIELDLVLNESFLPTLDNVKCTTEVGYLCQGLREHFISALRNTFVSVFGQQPLVKMPSVVCGLKCSSCRDSSHMAIVQPAKQSNQHPLYTWKCVHKRLPRILERSEQLIWFSPEKETTFEKKKKETRDGQWTIWVMKETDALESDLHLLDDSSPPSPPPPTWKEQYEKAIEQRGSVTLDITRCVLIGPPRVGKSSLKLFLINNEPPSEDVKKSTDLMEAPVVLTSIQYQDKKGSQWKELTTNELQQLVIKCTREEEYNPAQLNPIQPSHAVAAHTDNVPTTVTESSNTSMHLVDSELAVRLPDIVETAMSDKSLAKLKINGSVQPFAIPNPKQSTEIVSLQAKYNFFCKEVMSKKSLTELEMNGLKMVHVFDCGGQLAFQDTIPLLINAPCAFISVFNASIDLDEEVELKYCPEKGVELGLGHKESQWSMLRRIFSSIHSLQFKCHDDISQLLKDKTVVPSSPIAVVGTHKDVLQEDSKKDGGLRQSSTIKKIKDRLDQLRESKPYAFVREKGCTLDLVANRSRKLNDLSDIESLRINITESKATLSLELPLSWIILELFTRSCPLERKFIPFHDLQQLCIRNSIVRDKEEFSSLLQVLHVLGFYAFYQLDGVPEDQNWVCTDAATLYREVTKILVVQYKTEKSIKKSGATTDWQKYGRTKLNKATLQDVFTDLEISIGGADPMWFIRVLLHIGLAAKIEDEGQEAAFIPLALPFKRSDLHPVTSVATIYFTLEFPSGASKDRVHDNVIEIPRGIFPRLIVYLLSPQCLKEFKWQVDKGDSRSRIKLTHPSYEYTIYLSEHIDHIELDLVLNDTFLPTLENVDMCTTAKAVGSLCQGLRKHLESALGATFVSVFGKQRPERRPSVVCGLKCSACPDSSHMAIVRPAEKSTPQHPLYTWKCVHEPRLQSVKKPDQLIWFSPEKETTFKKTKTHDQDGRQWMIWVMKGTDASKLEDKPSSIELLDAVIPKVAADWEVLSIRLKLEDEGRIIAANYAKVEDRCRHILKAWTDGEGRKPVTWETLLEVMGKCGYKDLADELAERLKRGETLDK